MSVFPCSCPCSPSGLSLQIWGRRSLVFRLFDEFTLLVCGLRRILFFLCVGWAGHVPFQQEALSQVVQLICHALFLVLQSLRFQLDVHRLLVFLLPDDGLEGLFAVVLDDVILSDEQFRGVIEAIHG